MLEENAGLIMALAVLILGSSFFSATETAFSTVNRIRIKNLAADGNKKAQKVYQLTEKYDQLLSTVLVGNNIVNIAATAIATVLFTKLYGNMGATISTVVMTILVLVFGEITPKSLAKEAPESFAMGVVSIIQILVIFFAPLNYIFSLWKKLISKIFKVEHDDSMTQEELITIIEDAQQDGDLDEEDAELITAAIEFNDLEVKEILTPRVDVVAVNISSPLKDIEEVFRENRYSRLPVYENSIDNVIGVIHLHDFYYAFYNQAKNVKGIIKPVIFTSSHVKISNLLRDLQASKTHLAIVLDEYGGTLGIITMEDILEELVGEIYDEHDEVREYFHPIDDVTFAVEGECELDDMFELFDMEDDAEDYDVMTVSGWVIQQMHKIPLVGESFECNGLHVEVTDSDNKKVKEVRVKKVENV